MSRNIIKVVASVGATASSLYWGALPVLAGDVSLCPPTGQPQPPGCSGTVSVGNIVSSGISLLLFIAFIAALVYLIIGGIRWIFSGGDKDGTANAKKAVTSALIGLAVVLGAWILINIVLNFFGVTGGLSNLTAPTLKL